MRKFPNFRVSQLFRKTTDLDVDMVRTEPVGSSGDRSLLGPSSQRIRLTDDSPSERTPGHGKGSNEHASRDNHDDTGAFILGGGLGGRDTSEDEKPGSLPGRANDEWQSAAELFDHVETRESSGHIDGTKDELYSDRILNAGRVENGCSVLFMVSEAKRGDYG